MAILEIDRIHSTGVSLELVVQLGGNHPTSIMKANILTSFRTFLAALALGAACLAGCETVDPSSDTTVYPTAAEKNLRMQEQMSQMTRSFE